MTFDVLLVDDEADFLTPLRKRLVRRGLSVREANDGESALEAMTAAPADVCVLDVKMPGMDGLTLLTHIKNEWPLTEVVMLTGHASLEVALRGMELGAFDYLMKPVEFEELFYKLEDAAGRKRLHEEKLRRSEPGGRVG
ncbi:response regulator [Pseudodesulfovibrio cashew]|uniref:Response regulator n=1 Tax=Pseudodesulfovibrio cashew TaxID=2678688 RepID=A0A6I6JGA9_9BACT|nr:response regulator [Pseudodesulfovibrio cashew]QGY40199.1 response regulator [Pseudodesulfovibrio cashew]